VSALVLGIDPGAVHTGWALLEFSVPSSPVWFVGGTCDEVETVIESLLADATRRPELVCIEQPQALHNPMANRNLIGAAWVGGMAAGFAVARGLDVHVLGPEAWRMGLIGRPRRGDNVDHKVEAFLRAHVRQFPARSSVHARDAAGVACVGYRAARLGGSRGTVP